MSKRQRTDTWEPNTPPPPYSSPPSVEAAETPMETKGGATAAGPGYRGAFVGETMENSSFNERHKEQLHITTRNVFTRDITWLSRGIVQNPTQFVSQSITSSPYYEDDSLRSEPINMYAPMFADQKLLNLLAIPTGQNVRPGYSKCKLNAIRFTLTMSSYRGSWIEDGYTSAQYSEGTQGIVLTGTLIPDRFNVNSSEPQPLSHYIYRDRYDEYSPADTQFSNILATPLQQGVTGTVSNVKEYRTKKFLTNEINGLTLVHSGENFHFERKVNSKGSYFLTSAQVASLFTTPTVFSGNTYDPNTTYNIQSVINEVEGITPTGGASLVQQLGEGYNLLVVPASMTYIPVKYADQRIGVQPGIKTQIHIKCEADWFLYDFSYGATNPLRSLTLINDENTVAHIRDYFKNVQEKKTKSKRLVKKHKQPDTVFCEPFKDTDVMKC